MLKIKIIQLRLLVLLLFTSSGFVLQAQLPPYYNDIEAFKKQDSINPPPQHAILFVGSSSFTRWTDVQSYFPDHTIINRGFGGSTLLDVIRYSGTIITPYHARQIVIYCGENDLVSSDSVTAEMVLVRFAQLFDIIRKNDPAVPVVFVSLKPSPSRQHLWEKMQLANKLIRKFLSKKRKTVFIDVYHRMFDKKGKVMEDLFVEDRLHMNEKGYRIWQKAIEPHLVK